jgi:hypothetical protein
MLCSYESMSSITTNASPAWTDAPTSTANQVITPALCAEISFSIFMGTCSTN